MIEARNLTKNYGPLKAVDGVSFRIEQGEVLGFMGPNGAGKTTTMKMLSCFFPPDDGTAVVADYDVRENPTAVRRNIGYLAENAPAYEEMTPLSFLCFCCNARGISTQARNRAVAAVAESCAIADVMHQPIGTLSKGYRRRVGLAQALVHDPPVLILDEPTDGLDPNQKHQVRRLIAQLAPAKSIIISTHILEEVDAVCNRMVIIDRGRIMVDSTPEDLRRQEGGSLEEVFRRITAGAREGVATP